MLGQNLSTEVSGGSFAAANAHGKVRQDITDGDAETLSTCFKIQIIVPWGLMNFEGFEAADAPNPSWLTGFSGDKALLSETYKNVAEGTEIFQRIGTPIDIESMFEKLGIPLLEGEEVDIRETASTTPGTIEAARRFTVTAKDGSTFSFEVDKSGAVKMHAVDENGDDFDAMWSADVPEPNHHHPHTGRVDRVATVASGIEAQGAEGFIEGQLYADALTDHGVKNQASEFRGPEGLIDKIIIVLFSIIVHKQLYLLVEVGPFEDLYGLPFIETTLLHYAEDLIQSSIIVPGASHIRELGQLIFQDGLAFLQVL